jgi:hypothetical protein
MRKRLILLLLGLVLPAYLATATFAEDVFVTKKGKRYHKANSRFIKGKDVEKISREEAEKRGLKPSSEILQDDAQQNDSTKK